MTITVRDTIGGPLAPIPQDWTPAPCPDLTVEPWHGVPVPVGTPSPVMKERVMYLRNKNTGEIFAVGAATYTLLTGPEWAERVKSEGAQAWDCEPLTVYALTVGSGRRRV